MIFKIALLFSIISIMLIMIWKNKTNINIRIIMLMLVYTYCIYLFTMGGRINVTNDNAINLIPGQSIYVMLSSPWNNRGGYEYVEIMGNILLFLPLGMFLREWLNCSYKKLAICAVLITLCIEYLQFYMGIGTFEIDDILNNVWGCLLGKNIGDILTDLKEKKPMMIKADKIASIAFVIFNVFALVLYMRFILKLGVIIKA